MNYYPGFFKKFSEKIEKYFDGDRILFDEKLDYSNSSRFSQDVWNICRTIPTGQTRTYKWIASKISNPIFAFCGIGDPNSFKIGMQKFGIKPIQIKIFKDHESYSSNIINRFPLIVPCHRVVSKNGHSVGFGGSNALELYDPDLRFLLINLESK